MPPYAPSRPVNHYSNHVRYMSYESMEPVLIKRQLYFIDERFVRFEDVVTVQECPEHHLHGIKESTHHLWYSPKELKKFRRNASRHVRRRAVPQEFKLHTNQEQCTKNRLSALSVVLELQHTAAQQKKNTEAASATTNIEDYLPSMEELNPETDISEMIAKAYQEVTVHCQLEALYAGIRGHMEVVENERKEAEKLQSDKSSSACLTMPGWLATLLNKKTSQQHLLL